MTEEELVALPLGNTAKVGRYVITRVPGGWIFQYYETLTEYNNLKQEIAITDTFVPIYKSLGKTLKEL